MVSYSYKFNRKIARIDKGSNNSKYKLKSNQQAASWIDRA